MPTKTKADLKTEWENTLIRAREIAGKADDESRNLTDGERDEITALVSKSATLKAQWSVADADQALADRLGGLDVDDPALAGAADLRSRGAGRKSIGYQFINHDEYKATLAKHSNGAGHIPKGAHIVSERMGFKTLITGGSDTSAGAFVINDNIGLQAGLDQFQRPLNVRGLVTPGTTTSDTVEWVQVTGTTNNAATVAESTTTATPGSPSPATGVKPESAMTLAKKTSIVRSFAHWIPATTRALSDAGQIRSLIDAFLIYGLAEELEDQIMNGDATGENFDGITHVSGTQHPTVTALDWLGALRRARTLVRTVGRSLATAYVLHPNDWEKTDLLVDNNGRYYFGGPQQLGTPTLWGLPVVESEAVAEGTAICADFRKAILWDREDASLQISTEHSDFFIRNMVAILAEERYAFGVIQPNAFVIVDLTTTTTG